MKEVDQLQAENQRLREEMDSHVMLSSDDYAKLHKDRSENKRLRAALEEAAISLDIGGMRDAAHRARSSES